MKKSFIPRESRETSFAKEEKNFCVGLKDCTAISDLSPMGEIRRTEFTDGTSNLAPIPFVRDYKACEKVMKRPQLRHQFAQHQSRRQGAGDAPGNWSISHECNAPTCTSRRGVFYIRAGLISVTFANVKRIKRATKEYIFDIKKNI